MEVAAGAAPAQHRVSFLRFEVLTTHKSGVFFGLEVRKSKGYRARIEGGGDKSDGLTHLVQKVLATVGEGIGEPLNRFAGFFSQAVGMQQR